MLKKGIVTNIQRFTIHDGPGMRTEIFLKGCPLQCEWCGNPETLEPYIQPGVYEAKCISEEKCGLCVESCPKEKALVFSEGKLTAIDRTRCTGCLACYEACPSDAIKKWGRPMSIEECMVEIRKDKGYYDRSGGGVTVSGGDPLVQSDFVAELFKACKKEGFHTCLESSLYGEWEKIEKILKYTDLIISDIKHMDPKAHQVHTGVENSVILDNLKKITEEERELILRIPVIPQVNENPKNIKATADFILEELGGKVRTLQLLSFMRLGEEKYRSLGMDYKMDHINLDREAFQQQVGEIATYFNDRGIHCQVGTKEKQ